VGQLLLLLRSSEECFRLRSNGVQAHFWLSRLRRDLKEFDQVEGTCSYAVAVGDAVGPVKRKIRESINVWAPPPSHL